MDIVGKPTKGVKTSTSDENRIVQNCLPEQTDLSACKNTQRRASQYDDKMRNYWNSKQAEKVTFK
jgi:hypothetical protein